MRRSTLRHWGTWLSPTRRLGPTCQPLSLPRCRRWILMRTPRWSCYLLLPLRMRPARARSPRLGEQLGEQLGERLGERQSTYPSHVSPLRVRSPRVQMSRRDVTPPPLKPLPRPPRPPRCRLLQRLHHWPLPRRRPRRRPLRLARGLVPRRLCRHSRRPHPHQLPYRRRPLPTPLLQSPHHQ